MVGSKLNLQFLPVVRMLYCCGPRFRPDRPKLRRGYLHTVGTDRRYWAGISGLLIMHPRRHVRMFRTESGYIAVYWSSWTKRFRHNWHPMSVWIPESRLPDVLLFRWMQSGNLVWRIGCQRIGYLYTIFIFDCCRHFVEDVYILFWTHNRRAGNRRIFHWPRTVPCSSCSWWCQKNELAFVCMRACTAVLLPVWFHSFHNGWEPRSA